MTRVQTSMTFSIKKKATELVFVGLWHLEMNLKLQKEWKILHFCLSAKLQNTRVIFEYYIINNKNDK